MEEMSQDGWVNDSLTLDGISQAQTATSLSYGQVLSHARNYGLQRLLATRMWQHKDEVTEQVVPAQVYSIFSVKHSEANMLMQLLAKGLSSGHPPTFPSLADNHFQSAVK